MPRFGGPVFNSTSRRKTKFSSLNDMSRIREGGTWKFHCNLYIECQDLLFHFSVVLQLGNLILVVSTVCRVSEKVAHGSFIVICI